MSLPRPSRLHNVIVAAVLTLACSSRPGVQQQTPPPTITFESPVEASYVHGSITVTAKAQGVATIKTFTFTAPTALGAAAPTLDPVNHAATLSTTLDLSPFPDGVLKITVTAKDDLGGTTSKDLTVNVAAKAPTITIGSPSAGATVTGSGVAVTATAAAQAGATITKLEILTPPAGLGANTSAAAAFFAATWNSTLALEGSATLHFRATDSTGLIGDASITVTVDNVPAGRLDTYVFTGAPVANANIDVWALSDADGSIDTTAGNAGLLGSGGPTDVSGHVLVTLTAENYSGPIQLRARPASGTTLQYIDPSDPSNGFIQIPSGLTLSSLIAHYTTGQAITAPISLTTTLADAELLAYAAGLHRLHAGPKTITAAAAYGDGLFTQHVQASTPRWLLRTTVPVDLAAGPTTLTDRAYAAFTDVALNQLGKDLGTQVHVSGVINAPFLVAKLISDLAGDGQLDGFAAGGVTITTQTGSPPYPFDANTLRVKLANALDTWSQSVRNQSGLDRSTLAGAGIYNQIASDASELFGAQAPVPFDNVGPTVTTTITYGPSNAPPYGGTFVSGTTKIVLVATDTGGVKSVSAKLGVQTLDAAATSVTSPDGQTLTYTVNVNTTLLSDLSYTLSVTATDQRTNVSNLTPATLTVDNTPPTVAQAQPSATTFYSSTVPFDGTATDGAGSGVASLTTVGFTGLVDGDVTAPHFLGLWTIPAGASEGTNSGTWSACDNVGNCATPALAAKVDRIPPAVAVSGTVPAYVSTNTITFAATATDAGAGVAGVSAQVPGNSRVDGTFAAGKWTLTNVPLFVGTNSVQVWGVDQASPANGSAPSGIVVSVTRANQPPAPGLTAKASYIDERGITLSAATVPPAYTLANATKLNVGAGSAVYKASSRLTSAGLTPTILEGTNPDNIPYVQIQVPFGLGTAAVQSATYSVTVAGTPYSGDLLPWKSPASTTGADLYDLPLSADLFPALAQTAGAISLSINATVTDMAGQVGTLGATSVTLHVLGAPLFVNEDTSYPTYGDPRSTHPYKLPVVGGSSYSTLFTTSGSPFFLNNVRIVRYIISNPSSVPVAVSTTLTTPTWSAGETWSRFRGAEKSTNWTTINVNFGSYFTVDGMNLHDATMLRTNPVCLLSGAIEAAPPTNPCAGVPWNDSAGTKRLAHVLGDTVTRWTCVDEAATSPAPAITALPDVAAFASPQQSGGEVTSPSIIGGKAVVPAAVGPTPGQLVVYVTRPVGAVRSTPLTWNAITAGNRYEQQESWLLIWKQTANPGYGYCWEQYEPALGGRYLSSAAEGLTGSLQFATTGVTGGALIGESASGPAFDLTRTIAH